MGDALAAGYDVVVVGGGAAGLSGALMLGRVRRSVAVIDAGAPPNPPPAGVHGLLGHEGVPPAELLARGRAEVRGYGGHVVEGEVTAAAPATCAVRKPRIRAAVNQFLAMLAQVGQSQFFRGG